MTKFPPQYHWREGHFSVLEHGANVFVMPPRGTFVLVWHGLDGKYEYCKSNGQYLNRIWDVNHLPAEFRAHLLLLGVQL